MLLDQVTDTQMRAAQILGGATMAVLIGARIFRRRAQMIRLVVAGIYFAAMLGFLVYFLL